jgi:hypothetical protein
MDLYTVTYWCAIVFLVLGCLLGLLGVWMPEFWRNDYAWKLMLTNWILFGASVAGAVITRILK